MSFSASCSSRMTCRSLRFRQRGRELATLTEDEHGAQAAGVRLALGELDVLVAVATHHPQHRFECLAIDGLCIVPGETVEPVTAQARHHAIEAGAQVGAHLRLGRLLGRPSRESMAPRARREGPSARNRGPHLLDAFGIVVFLGAAEDVEHRSQPTPTARSRHWRGSWRCRTHLEVAALEASLGLAQQPGLAHARLALHHHQLRLVARGQREDLAEALQLAGSAHEARARRAFPTAARGAPTKPRRRGRGRLGQGLGDEAAAHQPSRDG